VHKQELTIEDLERKLDALPMLPSVVTRLLSLRADDDDFFEKVVDVAREDPPLATRLLRLANSASSAPASPITALPQAVTRIGARSVAGLVTSMAVLRVFVPTTDGQRRFWIHSIQAGVAAQTIARSVPKLGIAPEQAYLCGLMHDIGRFVLFEGAPEELGRVDETNWATPAELIAAEKEICGFDHAELGWHACRKWGLPSLVSEVVQTHHVYAGRHGERPDAHMEKLVEVVQMADFLSLVFIGHPEIEEWSQEAKEALIAKECIHPAWSSPPMTARSLAGHAQRIFLESHRMIDGLGLTPG